MEVSMFIYKKTLLSALAIFFSVSAFAGQDDISVSFSLTAPPISIEGGANVFQGTYITRVNGIVVDNGVFFDVVKSLGDDNNNCDSSSFNNIQTFGLYGSAGTVTLSAEGNTASGNKNVLQAAFGSGVYAAWIYSDDINIAVNCSASSNQYVLSGEMRTNNRHKNK